MDDIQATLQQKLIEQTQLLVARGGPGEFTSTGPVRLHYEPVESWRRESSMVSPDDGETYYPLAAVIAALESPSLDHLQQHWNGEGNPLEPLPLYLHLTADGHYTAMVGETFVLTQLIYLTPMCIAVMMAP